MPYTNWDTAAHVIQDAVDVSDPGDTVNVTNGVYQTGGRSVYETLTNRVAITTPLTVRSVNGRGVTIILGNQAPGTTNGPGAVRGVYLTNNTTLIGFTITHGATYTNSTLGYDENAGGVLCENLTNSVLSNCVITANSAYFSGGGVSGGTLNNCLISSNSALNAFGGGVAGSTARHCLFVGNYSGSVGGAAFGNSGEGTIFDKYTSALTDCTLIGNSANSGGGAYEETLINCILANNQCFRNQWWWADQSLLYSCTIVSNSCAVWRSAGIASSATMNSIIYYNNGPNMDDGTPTGP